MTDIEKKAYVEVIEKLRKIRNKSDEKMKAGGAVKPIKILGLECETLKDIDDMYWDGYINSDQADKYAARLKKKNGLDENGKTVNEYIFSIVSGLITDLKDELSLTE